MAIVELFSKRQKRSKGEMPDVYVYEEIQASLRAQIFHIIKDTIGQDKHYRSANGIYTFIYRTLCKEHGLLTLKEYGRDVAEDIFDYFLNCEDYEKCLDIIELIFRVIEQHIAPNYYSYESNTTSIQNPDDAVKELNSRFQESGVGYRFESGKLIRIDSQFIHSEIVKPVLHFLGTDKKYKGANDEFLSAHEHYRHKRYKECLNECLKSFESLMKAIHEKHSWSYNQNDAAKKLIESCFEHDLVPKYLGEQFSAVKRLLESGTPTVRNKEGGHGQGAEISTISEHLASYALHLTATNLLFLANCEKECSQSE